MRIAYPLSQTTKFYGGTIGAYILGPATLIVRDRIEGPHFLEFSCILYPYTL